MTITGVDNDVDAADKTVTVSGTVSATSVTAPANRTLTLEDDDAAGVRVSETALTVTEQDAAGGSYTLVLDTEPTHEVTVTVSGHAGTDVSLSASTLTFTTSNWDRAQTVTVTALNDDDTADDAVTLTHAATSTDGNYSGITIAGVSVTVTDNDTTTPAVTLALSAASIGENGGLSTVTATVSPASAAAFTVTVAAAAAAMSPAVAADFRLSANTVLSFAENATASTGSVTITGVDNDVDAADKTVTVSGTVSATGVTAPSNRTLTLEDDDATNAPPSFITLAEFEVEENVRTVDTVAAEDNDTGDAVTGYSIAGGADQALFMVIASSGDLEFRDAPNFEAPSDADTDNDYVVTVQATSGTGTREKTATQTITVTVTDVGGEAPGKPAAPTVAAASVTSLTVNWSAPSNAGPAITDYDVQYREGTSGSWTDGNYTGTATTATLSGLSENTSHQVQVRATNDEGTGAWSDAGSGTTDANAAPAPEAPQAEAQAGSYTSLAVSWTAPDTGDGAAITGYEIRYRESPGGEWESWPHDGTGAAATITELEVNTAYDIEVRALYSEMQSVWVRVPGQVRTGAPPAVSIAAANPTVPEGQPAVFTLSRTGATGSALTVTVALTEQADRDLLPDGAATQRTVTFAPGSSTAALTVELKNDESAEPDRDLTAAVRAGAGYTVGDPSTATVTVEDDDAPTPPVIEDIDVVSTPRLWSRGAGEADTYGEGENIRIGVRFDQPVHVEGYPVLALEVGDPCISVCEARYESGDGTDTLVFAYLVLDTEIDRNGVAIPANPIGESIDDFDGFSIRNEAGQEAHLSYRRKGTQRGHKVDGTRQAGQYFSVEDAEAREADGEMAFTVRLEPRGLGIVTVDYATRDGSGDEAAVAGLDYTETRGTLRFNPLEAARTVTVPIIDDDEEDDGETFTLRLSNPDGAVLKREEREATGTIRNSDPKALSASFPASAFASSSHSGADDRPQAVVAFSEAVAAFAADTPSVSVTGGAVASVRPHAEDGLEHAWMFFLVPDGDGDVTFALAADAACAAGGICTPGGRTLTEAPAASTIPGPGAPEEAPLTASFEDLPAGHDGESAFTFRIAFSEPLSWMNGRRLREDVVAVAGGRASSAGRVNRRRDLWQLTVEPDSSADVTVTVEAGAACGTPAAVCAKDGRALSATISATVAGPDGTPANAPAQGRPTIAGTVRVGETLTASTSGITDADGLDNAAFAYQWLRGGADIPGATGADYAAADADEGERLKVRVAFEDDAGHTESLTSAATGPVEAAPRANAPAEGRPEIAGTARVGETLTVSTSDISDADGLDDAVFRYQWIRGDRDIGGATGRTYTAANADEGERLKVRVRFTDDAGNRESVTSGSTKQVAGRPLPKVSVADARVHEAAGATLDFAVTLSAPPPGPVTVDYRTVDASAKAGEDYEARAGTLAFAAGETEKTLRVTVLDDAVDEGEEKMVVVLDPGPGVARGDRLATGTIENHDPMPRALLARFGRTAAVHVVEHVEERLEAPRAPGFRGRFAGRELRPGMERDMALGFLRQLQGMAGAGSRGADSMGAGPMGVASPMGAAPAAGAATLGMSGPAGGGGRPVASAPLGGAAAMGRTGGALSMGAGRMGTAAGPLGGAAPTGGGSGPDDGFDRGRLLRMGLGGGDVLTGSDFAMNRETRGGILSFWSRGAQSRFAGREGALSLGGDVRTTMFGADYARGPLVAGLSLSNSRGLGEYTGASGGQVASSVTGLYPWLGYQATDRVKVWGVAGYGTGGMLLTPQSGQALESGLSMAMAAAGTRGELVAGGAGGFALAFKADALWVGTAIDGVDGPAGRLKATDAAVTRFRTGLEGSRAYTLAGRLSLRPSVEVGLRHDGGDAETGAGMDVGVGLVVSDAGSGLAVDVRVRTLLVHQDKDFSERGVAVSLSYNPTPSSPLGFLARVAPSWGGQATSGAEALWGRETMVGMARGGVAQGNSLDAEVGYGLPVGSRLVGTPKFGLRTSAHGKDYRLGYSLGVLSRERLALDVGVEAQRRENAMQGGASNGVLGRASLGW